MPRARLKRLKRYHKQIFFPKWAESSIQQFSDSTRSRNSISFSLHALEKSLEYGFEYGRKFLKFLFRIIREDVLKNGEVFEFYTVDDMVKKACFRITSDEVPVDLVLVISADGVVVTVFVLNKGDNHDTLDKNLYERNE